MSALAHKRTRSSPASKPPGKKHKQNPSTTDPKYVRVVHKLHNYITNELLLSLSTPLKDFWHFLNNHSKNFSGPAEYVAALNTVASQLGDYLTLLKMDNQHAAEERQLPIKRFCHTLGTVGTFENHNLQLRRMNYAIKSLAAQLKTRKEVAQQFRKNKAVVNSETKQLRLLACHLVATNAIVLNRDLAELSYNELKALVNSRRDVLLFHALDLQNLHTNHNCRTCTNYRTPPNAKPFEPKYPSPADGSGTPQIPGLFPTGAVSLDDLAFHNFRFVTRGTTCGLANVPGSSAPELALMIHFPDFNEGPVESSLLYLQLAQLLHLGSMYATKCDVNGPNLAVEKSKRGIMQVLGWRCAYNAIPWGRYACPPKFKSTNHGKWFDFQESCVPLIEQIMNQEFERTFGSFVVRQAQDHMRTFRLPPFGATSNNEETWRSSLGSNFTLSHSNFANEPHLDSDNYRYVFSVYVFVNKDGDLITDPKVIADCMRGGYLIWPDLHLALKPEGCTGVIFLYWRGTHERHCTMTSETLNNNVIRYGTSIQVTKRLFNSVQTFHARLDAWEKWHADGMNGEAPDLPYCPKDLNDL